MDTPLSISRKVSQVGTSPMNEDLMGEFAAELALHFRNGPGVAHVGLGKLVAGLAKVLRSATL